MPSSRGDTTPRPIKLIKELVADPLTAVTRGHTLENRVNLAPPFLKRILSKYEGTRLGRQELAGEILGDNPEALWNRAQLDATRVVDHPPLMRIAVGVDPEVSSEEGSAETGIIVAGIAKVGSVLHGYVLDDRTLQGTPDEWASSVVSGYHVHKANLVVGEVNNGGEMVGYTVKTKGPGVPFKAVHASRGKYTRAEPVSALYEQGRVHHVGNFAELEDQLCEWVPTDAKSPDRLDALVWALTELMIEPEPEEGVEVFDSMQLVKGIDLR